MGTPCFVHSQVEGHLGCLQFLPVKKNAALNIDV